MEQPSDPSVANRYAENVVALQMFRDHPLLGVGPANYSPRYVAYAQRLGFDTGYAGGPYRANEQEAHNLYLEALAESGVLGGLVLFGTFALALLASWRARARLPRREALLAEGTLVALLVVLTASIFLHNAYPRYPWIFVGLALAAGRLARGVPAETRERPGRPGDRRLGVAYVMSRFPKISETFILNEILVLERLGVRVEVFPLLSEDEDVRHPEADRLVARAHHARLLSPAVLGAQAAWLAGGAVPLCADVVAHAPRQRAVARGVRARVLRRPARGSLRPGHARGRGRARARALRDLPGARRARRPRADRDPVRLHRSRARHLRRPHHARRRSCAARTSS